MFLNSVKIHNPAARAPFPFSRYTTREISPRRASDGHNVTTRRGSDQKDETPELP